MKVYVCPLCQRGILRFGQSSMYVGPGQGHAWDLWGSRVGGIFGESNWEAMLKFPGVMVSLCQVEIDSCTHADLRWIGSDKSLIGALSSISLRRHCSRGRCLGLYQTTATIDRHCSHSGIYLSGSWTLIWTTVIPAKIIGIDGIHPSNSSIPEDYTLFNYIS